MPNKLKLLGLIVISLFFFSTNKAFSEVDNQFSLWNKANIYSPITNRLKINLDIQNRVFFNEGEVNNIFLLRPSVGVELFKGFSFWQGYGYFNYSDSDVFENRLWQQLQHEKLFSRLWLVNRFRMEERLFENLGISDNVSTRGKYLLRMMFPFTKKKHWFFVLSDEISFNFNDALSGLLSSGYDANKAFVGFNFRPNDYITLETGYQLEHQHYSNTKLLGGLITINPVDPLNHSVLFNIYFSTPQLFKKKIKPQTILPPF